MFRSSGNNCSFLQRYKTISGCVNSYSIRTLTDSKILHTGKNEISLLVIFGRMHMNFGSKANPAFICCLILVLFPCFIFAQKNKSRSMWYGGAGLFSPSATMKQSSMLKNGMTWRTGYLYSFRSSSSFQFGLEARVDYSKFPSDLKAPASVSGLRYSDGSSVQSVSLQLDVKSKKPDAFQYLAGPALSYSTKNFFVQSSFLFGYASVSQEPFAFHDLIRSATDPTQNTDVIFYRSGHETNNGFVFVPGIKAGTDAGRHFSFFVAFDYSRGSMQHFSDETYLPDGTPVNGVYTFQQMTNGFLLHSDRFSWFRAFAITANAGFRF
jgi:hypothetical protein